MANIWEITTLILAGNLNSGLSYLITTVHNVQIRIWQNYILLGIIFYFDHQIQQRISELLTRIFMILLTN